MPRVRNRSALEPAPPGAVNVMRPSKWGNPFRIGPDGDRTRVLALYRACHGDILLEIANV